MATTVSKRYDTAASKIAADKQYFMSAQGLPACATVVAGGFGGHQHHRERAAAHDPSGSTPRMKTPSSSASAANTSAKSNGAGLRPTQSSTSSAG